MKAYLLPLEAAFKKHANKKNALAIKAYLRNQFESYGIHTPTRRTICLAHMKSGLPTYDEISAIVKACWEKPERDWHYFAVELIAAYKKHWDEELIGLIEWLIVHKSWWDTVDHIASELTGPYFLLFPKKTKQVTSKWNRSDNFWLQRSSLMFQKKYREKTNLAILSQYILNLRNSEEFFVQKAIGWALREYSKTNPKWVEAFVSKHALPPLSKREALKRITGMKPQSER